jgi:putative peptide zinc metalloprotease protein
VAGATETTRVARVTETTGVPGATETADSAGAAEVAQPPADVTDVTDVTDGSRVRLRALCARRDGDGWVIGRIDTGEFVSVPDVAYRVVTLLSHGLPVDEVSAVLREQTGTRFAVADFVIALDELGFVAALDGRPRADLARPRPSLPWLRPQHVRWLLDPVAPFAVAGFAVAAVTMLALHPALLPSYRVLVWNSRVGLVLAVNAAILWLITALHELGHLTTARAAGAPARMTLSTRLQFLVAQTDVSGVWAAPRRTRMTVYLAGMAVQVCVAGACLLVLGTADPPGVVGKLLAVAVAEAILMLPAQFMVFMRTDLYFVLQDVTGCANLYADGSAYVRYLGRGVLRRIRAGSAPEADPSRGYPPPQRRAVRAYSAVLLTGTALCLGVAVVVSLPATIAFIVRAVTEVAAGTPAGVLDGAVALAVPIAWQLLWATRWWQRHHHQARAAARRLLRTRREVNQT